MIKKQNKEIGEIGSRKVRRKMSQIEHTKKRRKKKGGKESKKTNIRKKNTKQWEGKLVNKQNKENIEMRSRM